MNRQLIDHHHHCIRYLDLNKTKKKKLTGKVRKFKDDTIVIIIWEKNYFYLTICVYIKTLTHYNE